MPLEGIIIMKVISRIEGYYYKGNFENNLSQAKRELYH